MKIQLTIILVLLILVFSCKKEEKEDDNTNNTPVIPALPTNVPDGDFEQWTLSAQSTYEEPSSGWWTSLNVLKNLGGPESIKKTTDAHTGNYAAKLITSQWGELIIPGILLSGIFDFNAPNMIIEGKPFTEKPLKIKGYYKYTSVNGDSAAIYANITKYNLQTSRRDTIADARLAVLNTVQEYTMFDLDFDYFITGQTPDSISIVFASSADGGNFNGAIGSTLYIDDVSLVLQNGSKLKILR